jgi:allantoate deiminase
VKDGSEDLVATVGTIEARPGAANVIPGKVTLSLDVRALDPAVRDRAANAIISQAHKIAAHRDIGFRSELVHDLPASPCDPQLTNLLDAAMRAKGHPPRRLASGAGHDAMVMAALCPTAMLFIRCAGGVSHNPAEHVTGEDADAALQVMLGFIDRLGDAIDHV